MLEVDDWVRQRPSRKIRTRDTAQQVVTAWLRAREPEAATQVLASWSEDDAIVCPWSVFCDAWLAICYPSSDHLTVLPLSEAWGLTFALDTTFSWRGALAR